MSEAVVMERDKLGQGRSGQDRLGSDKRRRGKNLALLAVLAALVVLLYAVTMVRLGMLLQ
jgi:hypothetical protein